jgi:rRNA maturation endonuclease Nob1
MSKLVGMLRGRKVYDNDPRLIELECNVDYAPVRAATSERFSRTRCDYCKRTSNDSRECESCGAPLA